MRRTFLALATLVAALPARAAEILPAIAPDGRAAILLRGAIINGDEFLFDDAVKAYPRAGAIILDSPGGLILPALAIGRKIRDSNLSTMVLSASTCASACADIWLAARHRYLGSDAHIGFHGVFGSDGKTLTMTGAGNALVGAYLGRLGYSDSVVLAATGMSPNDMLWLDPHQPFGPTGITFETITAGTPH